MKKFIIAAALVSFAFNASAASVNALEEIWAKEAIVYRATAKRILLIKKIADSDQEKAAFYNKVASQKKHFDVAALTTEQLEKMSVQKAANKSAAQAMSISLHNLLIPFIREFPGSYID